MDNSLQFPDQLQLLREHVARYGHLELPPPNGLAHCDDCSAYGDVWARGTLALCWRDWLRRELVRVALERAA